MLKVSAKTDLRAAEKQMTGKYILNGNNYQFITATWSRFFEKGQDSGTWSINGDTLIFTRSNGAIVTRKRA